ncbi:MAG: type III-B CRISPR-associated protein Cas10/Cmr2 [Ignavibacteriales bacterium]|nr:type III-B CRISPR-associated protein Cas10/Cmr2 [Ignavibacteriales bacterium]
MDIQRIIDEILTGFGKKSKIPIAYLKNYINCYHLSVELADNENIILRIYQLLDSLELQQRVLENANLNYIEEFLEKINPYNFLLKSEFEERPFPSTIEITTSEFEKLEGYIEAAKELRKKDDEENQTNFIKAIKKIADNKFRNYQKYIAVVQADGDYMGAFIKQLYGLPNKDHLIKQFSKNLLSFAIESVELIKKFSGTPIYAGGDDLLYFMPVAQTNTDGNITFINKTVFSLIAEIDKIFNKYFTDFNEEGIDFKGIIAQVKKKPSMSYGVSISYYKFPLNQALEEGVNQLFNIAKKTDKKNAVSYTILKHSGQYFGTTFHKDETSYTTFNELIKENLTGDNFIHSVIYKLDPQKEVIKEIGKIAAANRADTFNNFFLNNFNESVHRDKNDRNKLVGFLTKTKQLFIDIYNENELNNSELGIDKQNEINLNKIYSALRFIDFIHNKEERDD